MEARKKEVSQTEAQHTPTPWKLKKQSDSPGDILDANGKDTATTNTPFLSDEQMEETAAYIVRAVNAHGELLALAKKRFDSWRDWVGDVLNPDFDDEYQALKQAIAKAEGE